MKPILVDARTRRFMRAATAIVGDIEIDVYATGAPLPPVVPPRMFKCVRLHGAGYQVDSIHGRTVAGNLQAACAALAWAVVTRARTGDYTPHTFKDQPFRQAAYCWTVKAP